MSRGFASMDQTDVDEYAKDPEVDTPPFVLMGLLFLWLVSFQKCVQCTYLVFLENAP